MVIFFTCYVLLLVVSEKGRSLQIQGHTGEYVVIFLLVSVDRSSTATTRPGPWSACRVDSRIWSAVSWICASSTLLILIAGVVNLDKWWMASETVGDFLRLGRRRGWIRDGIPCGEHDA